MGLFNRGDRDAAVFGNLSDHPEAGMAEHDEEYAAAEDDEEIDPERSEAIAEYMSMSVDELLQDAAEDLAIGDEHEADEEYEEAAVWYARSAAVGQFAAAVALKQLLAIRTASGHN